MRLPRILTLIALSVACQVQAQPRGDDVVLEMSQALSGTLNLKSSLHRLLEILAKRHGARLVIVNREETPMDGLADLVIHGEIGAVMTAAVPEHG